MRTTPKTFYAEGVLPVFAIISRGGVASRYRGTAIKGFSDPVSQHRRSDRAGNHATRLGRRFLPPSELTVRHTPGLRQSRRRAWSNVPC